MIICGPNGVKWRPEDLEEFIAGAVEDGLISVDEGMELHERHLAYGDESRSILVRQVLDEIAARGCRTPNRVSRMVDRQETYFWSLVRDVRRDFKGNRVQ